MRAAVQLLAVGLLLQLILDSTQADVWAWVWVAGMVLLSAEVVYRRSPVVPRLRLMALASMAVPTAVVLALAFGLGARDVAARHVEKWVAGFESSPTGGGGDS